MCIRDRYLPVYFDVDLGLYIWNTTHPSFARIVSSPHYMSLTFASDTSSGSGTSANTIQVPFALLNLTLENPLVTTSMQYFPCSPYTPADGATYHLGRAFLQAAYLAQSWQTNKTLLSQAPGPDNAGRNEDIKTISTTDTSITPMINAPLWNATWATKLKALAANSNSPPPTTGSPDLSSSGLSGGAIAGIVVGAVVGLAIIAALVFFLLRRKRNTRTRPTLSDKSDQAYAAVAASEPNPETGAAVEAPGEHQVFEAPSQHHHHASPMWQKSTQTTGDEHIRELPA